MTEPINPKTEARKRTNPEGSADGAEASPTPQQRAVIERYLKRRDSPPDALRLIVKSKPNQPLAISHPSLADGAGLALAFRTTEGEVASILLNSLINAACDGTPGHPPSEQDVASPAKREIKPPLSSAKRVATKPGCRQFAATPVPRRRRASSREEECCKAWNGHRLSWSEVLRQLQIVEI
jgi:hypothetical protein